MNEFSHAYRTLNPEQKEAVDSIEGPVMVIAGPGTGKTEVLTLRIANILDKTDTPPEAILALTFTESGVSAMRKRLAGLIGSLAYRVSITTFHGFANSVIKQYPDSFPVIIGSTNISEVEQVSILQEIIDTATISSLKPFGDPYHYLPHVQRSINELKRQGVSPEKFRKITALEAESFQKIQDLYHAKGPHTGKMKGRYKESLKHIERNEDLALIYRKYQEYLHKKKFYDWSDMIMYVMVAMEQDEDFLLQLQEQYMYFLVDEHQDTNNAQNRILELLASYHTNPNLFVVGDEKQAIFRFQGASLENFLYFQKLYKNVKLITLVRNYRSTQTILDTAHSISPRKAQLRASDTRKEEPIYLCACSSPEMEYYFLARKIQELLKKGTNPEDIAILYRENRDAFDLARVLEKMAIPFHIESSQDVLEDTDMKKLVRILKAIFAFGSEPELFEYLAIDFLGIEPLDIYKLARYARTTRTSPYDILASDKLLGEAGIGKKKEMKRSYALLSSFRKDAENMGAVPAFERIVERSGFVSCLLAHDNAMEKMAKLHSLFDRLKALVENKKGYTIEDFFSYITLLQRHHVSLGRENTGMLPGKIRLMTAHHAKGLEFSFVFLIHAVESKWGSRHRREHIKLPRKVFSILERVEEDLESDGDERNLFYVALTRAKKAIYITHATHDREGKDLLPSEFIQEIKPHLLSAYPMDKYEKEYARTRSHEFTPLTRGNGIPVRDKRYVRHLFEEYGLSVTALGNYLTCPWKYFFVSLIRIPEAPTKSLLYGNAVHAALKSYFDAYARGENKGAPYLVQRFREALAHQPIEEKDFKEALKKGTSTLKSYHARYKNSWNRNILNEYKIDGIQLRPHVRIGGKLDKIEILDTSSNVNVVDYKTGKVRSRNAIEGKTKSSDGQYKRQLVFYSLLLQMAKTYHMVSGEIDFIEPNTRGVHVKEKFEITKEEQQKLQDQILEVADAIRSLSFWNETCGKKDCKYCEMRSTLY